MLQIKESLILMVCVSLTAASACFAATEPESTAQALFRLQETDLDMYHGVTRLGGSARVLLNERVLATVSGPESKARIERMDQWQDTPFSLTARIPEGELRIRTEIDFTILWVRRDTAVPTDGSPLEVIRRATEGFLAEVYQPGPVEKVAGVDGPVNQGQEIRLVSDATTLPGTTAIWCRYMNVSDETRRWDSVLSIDVLVNGRDVVVVCESAKARQGPPIYTYEGLLAAKIRLNETEAKEVAHQAVLAENTIFTDGVDLEKLPSRLLNGCMWPLAGYVKTDAGPAQWLQKGRRPASTPEEPTGPRQPKEIKKTID